MSHKLGVVILNYGATDDTNALYRTLTKYVENVIIVDNYSSEKTIVSLKEKFSLDQVILSQNNGYGPGNNLGLKSLFENDNIDACIVMNPDIQIDKFDFQGLFTDIDVEKPILFGGVVIENGIDIGVNLFNPRSFKSRPINSNSSHLINAPIYPAGSLWGINRAMWNKGGGFVEDYFLYFEELEYIYRYKKFYGSFPLVIKTEAIKIFHSQGGSTGISPDLSLRSSLAEFYSARNRIKFGRDFDLKIRAVLYNISLFCHRVFHLKINLALEILRATLKGFK
jgi:N-acetylglucosaminyl-diphospho-decaprenol L-rhamnosyltransferase